MSISISLTGRFFALIAFIEAATWGGLLVGMFLKHVTDTTELGVQVFGLLHGVAFCVYVVTAIAAAIRLRWSWQVITLALLASIPPLVTIPLEVWLRHTGRLNRAPARSSAATLT